jgi:hypothetical protein
MKLVTKYQIPAINSYREKCDEKYLGRTEGWKDLFTDNAKIIIPPLPEGGGGIRFYLRPSIRPSVCPSILPSAETNATKNELICSMCIKINKVGKQEVGI